MADPARWREVAHVRPHHFSDPVFGRLWTAFEDLISSNRDPAIATLADRFRGDVGVDSLGGASFLFDVYDHGVGCAARQHAESVVDGHVRRTGVAALADASRALLQPDGRDGRAILGQLRQDMDALTQDAALGDGELTNGIDAAVEVVEALDVEAAAGRSPGLLTGLSCFDRRLRGLRPGHLIVVGGRPSMGKTSLLRCAAYGAARLNPEHAFLMFSLEMSRREIAERALSSASWSAREEIAYAEFGAGLPPYQRQSLRNLQSTMPPNILIDDRSDIGVEDIARRVWAIKTRRPVGAVCVDYLQLLRRPGAGAGRNDAALLGEVTRALKVLAREAECTVILASQLNRQVESRDDKRPHLADLRDSGSIEQDANAVIFPFREAYYLERAEPANKTGAEYDRWRQNVEIGRRAMEAICAKNRGGAIGVDRLTYFAEYDHVAGDGDGR